MKNKSYIGISFIILVFGILTIPEIVTRWSNNDIIRDRRIENSKENVSTLSGLSKHNKVPDFEFINQNGIKISNNTLNDKVYVVEFFFTTCPTICPVMNKNMKRIEESFMNDNDFAIASITINPDYDTPEVLKDYMASYDIKFKNWHMLTGNRDAIFDLSNKGFNIYAGMDDLAPGGFEHSGLFALVDKNGYIRSRDNIFCYRGIEQETKDELGNVIDVLPDQITELKEDIVKLLNE